MRKMNTIFAPVSLEHVITETETGATTTTKKEAYRRRRRVVVDIVAVPVQELAIVVVEHQVRVRSESVERVISVHTVGTVHAVLVVHAVRAVVGALGGVFGRHISINEVGVHVLLGEEVIAERVRHAIRSIFGEGSVVCISLVDVRSIAQVERRKRAVFGDGVRLPCRRRRRSRHFRRPSKPPVLPLALISLL